jgi:hypothetical protein
MSSPENSDELSPIMPWSIIIPESDFMSLVPTLTVQAVSKAAARTVEAEIATIFRIFMCGIPLFNWLPKA